MKRIIADDIHQMNDIIMELPAFRELKSRDMIHDVLDTFMDDVYLKTPGELLDTMEFNINDRMQETFFTNYGIDEKYSKKLKGYLKEDLAYQLEKLFQGKGSKDIFRIFGDVFENIFRKINFYNIRVFKIPTSYGFRFEYRLVPLHIADEDQILERPQIPVEQTRKYLMELENFQDYTAWPMPTNLVYIQLSIGEEIINNMNTFLDGARAYGTTYLQGKTINYIDRFTQVEKIYTEDLELLTSYFRMEITKKKEPTWDFSGRIHGGSFLPYDPNIMVDPSHPMYQEAQKWASDRTSFLQNMQELLEDYGNADRRSRPEMEMLRRRWQFFLRLKENTEPAEHLCYNDYDSFVALIEEKYPLVKADFLYYLELSDEDNEPLFDFYVYIYSIFLSGAFAQPEDPSLGLNQQIVIDYIDVVFGGLFVEADFLKWYFNPVMDLFIRYFFPIEMEYINDLIPKVSVRDKWNAVSYEEDTTFTVNVGKTSLHPMCHLDYKRFDTSLFNRRSHIIPITKSGTLISTPVVTEYEMDDTREITPLLYKREELEINDWYDTRVLRAGEPVQRLSGCISSSSLNNQGTKEYLVGVLNTYINNKK